MSQEGVTAMTEERIDAVRFALFEGARAVGWSRAVVEPPRPRIARLTAAVADAIATAVTLATGIGGEDADVVLRAASAPADLINTAAEVLAAEVDDMDESAASKATDACEQLLSAVGAWLRDST